MNDVSLTYQLEFSEFSDFNMLLAGDIIQKSKRKVTICGVIEIAAACLLFFFNIVSGQNDKLYYVLSVALLFIGIFCVMFYPVFFEKQLTKSVAKEFNENPYFAAPTTLIFTNDGIKETNEVGEGFTEYDKLGDSFFYKDLLIIKLGTTNGFILPKRCMSEEKEQSICDILREKLGDLAKF